MWHFQCGWHRAQLLPSVTRSGLRFSLGFDSRVFVLYFHPQASQQSAHSHFHPALAPVLSTLQNFVSTKRSSADTSQRSSGTSWAAVRTADGICFVPCCFESQTEHSGLPFLPSLPREAPRMFLDPSTSQKMTLFLCVLEEEWPLCFKCRIPVPCHSPCQSLSTGMVLTLGMVFSGNKAATTSFISLLLLSA